MKIILTGSTGYVGSKVLEQCLLHHEVSSIIALSRRDLNIADPKLRVIIVHDFAQYSPEVLSEIDGADACIYCLGTNVPVRPPELNRTINFDYAIGTAKIFAAAFMENKSRGKFNFVYLSGALPEKDQNKTLWFLADNRRMRGQLENALLQLGQETKNSGFEVYIARPGFVQPEGAVLLNWIVGKLSNAIMLHHLAACLLQLAIDGHSDPIAENNILNAMGKLVIDGQGTSG
ncbi:hypothetical protein V1509DRAFT_649981 [Lipomyces kononenkoae]